MEKKIEVDVRITFRGYVFRPPFLCICCGKEVDAQQWAFGRSCGLCDTGICQSWDKNFKPEYAHVHPSWYRGPASGERGFEAFVEAVEAVPVAEVMR